MQDWKYYCDILTHIISFVQRRPILSAVCFVLYAVCIVLFAVGLTLFAVGVTLFVVYTQPIINERQRRNTRPNNVR
jgi:hypothetical protein